MVGSGARESNAVKVGAIIPHRLTNVVHDITVIVLVVMGADQLNDGSYTSSLIDAADSCSCADTAEAKHLRTIMTTMAFAVSPIE